MLPIYFNYGKRFIIIYAYCTHKCTISWWILYRPTCQFDIYRSSNRRFTIRVSFSLHSPRYHGSAGHPLAFRSFRGALEPRVPTRSRCYQFANGVSVDRRVAASVFVYRRCMRRQAWPAPRRSVCCWSSHWRTWVLLHGAQWVPASSPRLSPGSVLRPGREGYPGDSDSAARIAAASASLSARRHRAAQTDGSRARDSSSRDFEPSNARKSASWTAKYDGQRIADRRLWCSSEQGGREGRGDRRVAPTTRCPLPAPFITAATVPALRTRSAISRRRFMLPLSLLSPNRWIYWEIGCVLA